MSYEYGATSKSLVRLTDGARDQTHDTWFKMGLFYPLHHSGSIHIISEAIMWNQFIRSLHIKFEFNWANGL